MHRRTEKRVYVSFSSFYLSTFLLCLALSVSNYFVSAFIQVLIVTFDFFLFVRLFVLKLSIVGQTKYQWPAKQQSSTAETSKPFLRLQPLTSFATKIIVFISSVKNIQCFQLIQRSSKFLVIMNLSLFIKFLCIHWKKCNFSL